jgi:branched-chain amino acid transport system substrate-binding protein
MPQIPDELRINTLISDCLSNLPTGDESVVSFLAITVVGDWVFPRRFKDTLLLEAVLRVLHDHFFLLGPIDQDNAEQLRINILSFLNEDAEFNKTIEKKINLLKRPSRLNSKLIEQFRDIVNSSEGIDFIDSPEQNGLLRSGLGIYRENNKLFINRFYADHSLIVNFLKYIFWELLRRELIKFYLTVISTSIISIIVLLVAYKNFPEFFNKILNSTSVSPVVNSKQIAALCDDKQYGNLNISCGHPANNKEEDANKPDSLIYKNNQDILGQIKSGTLSEKDVYPIAAVVPLTGQARDVADNMLRAIARKQKTYNDEQNGSKLFVLIADDKNETSTGQNIAKKLGEIKVLLGVVGSYSSSNSAGVIQNYRTSKLVLVSPTTTATLIDLDKSYQRDIIKNDKTNLDTSFFFRPVGTTESQIEDVLQYLKGENKTKIILFWDSGDTYAQSLKNEFDDQNKNLSILAAYDSNGVKAAKLGDKTTKWVSRPDIKQDSTTILIFQGAYKDTDEVDEPRQKAKKIIRANQGHFLVIGSNPIYRTNLMCDFVGEPNIDTDQISRSLLIMQPWFPKFNKKSEARLYPQSLNCNDNDKNIQDSFVPWQSAMSEDAIEMLIYAINQASKNDDLTREGVQKALMGDEIQDETCTDKNKGINGLTGNITLHGSDRCNPSSELVRPIYLKDTKQWQWQKLPKPYK